jgi:hypothetical protein
MRRPVDHGVGSSAEPRIKPESDWDRDDPRGGHSAGLCPRRARAANDKDHPIRPYLAEKIPHATFPEVALQAATADQISKAFLPHNGNLGVVQGSAITMRAAGVRPEARIQLVNAHPQWAEWRFSLNTPPPQMYLRFAGSPAAELVPQIHLFVIEPDMSRVSVVWVGQTRRDAPPNEAQIENTQHAVVWRD